MDTLFDEFFEERYELSFERIEQIVKEKTVREPYRDYFQTVAKLLTSLCKLRRDIDYGYMDKAQLDALQRMNHILYQEMKEANYSVSYANPEYAKQKLGTEFGRTLSFLYIELRNAIPYVMQNRMFELTILLELFIEIYNIFEEDIVNAKELHDAIYYFNYDYCDVLLADRIISEMKPESGYIFQLVMNEDFTKDESYYKYGEIITDRMLQKAQSVRLMSEEMKDAIVKENLSRIWQMKDDKDLLEGHVVHVEFEIGEEMIVKELIGALKPYGVLVSLSAPYVMMMHKKGAVHEWFSDCGYAIPMEYEKCQKDHEKDDELFFDKALMERQAEVIKISKEENLALFDRYLGVLKLIS